MLNAVDAGGDRNIGAGRRPPRVVPSRLHQRREDCRHGRRYGRRPALAEPQQQVDAERLVQSHLDILARAKDSCADAEQAFLGRDAVSRCRSTLIRRLRGPTAHRRRLRESPARQRRLPDRPAVPRTLRPTPETKLRASFRPVPTMIGPASQPDVAERLHQTRTL